MEEQINNSQKKHPKLSALLQSTREEERNQIASELHDTVGQALTALKMDLFMLEKYLPQNQGKVFEIVNSMNVLLDHTIMGLRKIYTELRPTLLDLLGLEEAIVNHLDKFQDQTGIESELEIEMKGIELEKSRSLALFRILQEALNNVKWHSKATYVKVVLAVNSKYINLVVKDNGVGIDAKNLSNPSSFGLIGMKERVNFLAGKLEIEGIPKKGTTVKINFPI
ncbi:MAG: sensor histidine kinase [Candidatus Aminicenantes bacterium]|nr:sensor histidine kinase [Candidatus Aminicenantes bacterium]